MDVCNVCSVEFSAKDEGGVKGVFGSIPVVFCPTCLACMFDMTEQLSKYYEGEISDDKYIH